MQPSAATAHRRSAAPTSRSWRHAGTPVESPWRSARKPRPYRKRAARLANTRVLRDARLQSLCPIIRLARVAHLDCNFGRRQNAGAGGGDRVGTANVSPVRNGAPRSSRAQPSCDLCDLATFLVARPYPFGRVGCPSIMSTGAHDPLGGAVHASWRRFLDRLTALLLDTTTLEYPGFKTSTEPTRSERVAAMNVVRLCRGWVRTRGASALRAARAPWRIALPLLHRRRGARARARRRGRRSDRPAAPSAAMSSSWSSLPDAISGVRARTIIAMVTC